MQTEVSDTGDAPLGETHGNALMAVEIEITVSIGKARLSLSDLLQLRQNSVLQLDHRIDDPVDVFIGERLVARGELEETEEGSGQLCLRLTEVTDLSGGL